MFRKKERVLGVFALLLGIAFSQPAAAGFLGLDLGKGSTYVSGDVGFAFLDDLGINGSDNDVPTSCDQLLRAYAPAGSLVFADLNEETLAADGFCARGDNFGADAELDAGLVSALQVGQGFGNLRLEAEYLYRDHNSTDRNNEASIDRKTEELVDASQSISNFSAHGLFLNLYYDFSRSERALLPYLGVGIGWSKVEMVYDAKFTRNPNPVALTFATMDETPASAAGTTTHTEDALSDDVFGWQLLGGVDYAIDENWSIGVKLRYAQFDGVEDSGNWDQLRSHESAIAAEDYGDAPNREDAQTVTEIRTVGSRIPGIAPVPDFDPTVTYTIETDDMDFWGLSMSLKYTFGGE